MTRKSYAILYSDKSMNIYNPKVTLERAYDKLKASGEDDDCELVQVEIRVINNFGPKKKICQHN